MRQDDTAELEALLGAVRALYGAIERFDGRVAAVLGIDRTALRAVNAMETGAVSPTRLGGELGLASGSVTALLDRLERAGHVERVAAADDRRRRDARLTASARKAADAAYGRLGAAIGQAFADAPPEEIAAARDAVARLARAFDAAGR